MGRQIETYVPAIVVDRRNGVTRPKMVINDETELSNCYVKWEVYENLRNEFFKLAIKLQAVSNKHE